MTIHAAASSIADRQALSQSEPPHFDRLAKPYRWLEYFSFGPLLQRTRLCWLHEISHCENALVLGDGDGRFTAALLTANPYIHVHAVDVSAAMLHLLSSRCGSHGQRITTEQADLRTWTPQAVSAAENATRYDLIVTHFFLDCLTADEAANLANRLSSATTPETTWLVSEFAIPRTRYGRWVAAPVVALLYRAFGLITGLRVRRLPDHASVLEHAGWQLDAARPHAGGLLVSQLWKRIQQ